MTSAGLDIGSRSIEIAVLEDNIIKETRKTDTGNPIRAIAEKYLAIPCACMSPNQGRLTALSKIIERFKPDVVIDFILTACHS